MATDAAIASHGVESRAVPTGAAPQGRLTILLLAPQPFYQERGTPIATALLLRALSERGDRVEVLTYHEGEPVAFPGVTIHRIPPVPFARHIGPGFSLQKVICDVALAAAAWRRCRRVRYDLVHCVEESVYIGLFLRRSFGVPYIYDMDSSLVEQLLSRFPWLGAFRGLLAACERRAIRSAEAVVPMCEALATAIAPYHPRRVVVLRDISLLEASSGEERELRAALGLTGPVVVYAGNLERYQGIELLLDSFAQASRVVSDAQLVVVGGNARHIAAYRTRATALGIGSRVQFVGPQPVRRLGSYLRAADILVSPRLQGRNTPMKIYSYLHAGRAILATDLETHTQVLDHRVSVLARPTVEAFAAALVLLLQDADLRARLGASAQALAERAYSYPVFRRAVDGLYGAWGAARAATAHAS